MKKNIKISLLFTLVVTLLVPTMVLAQSGGTIGGMLNDAAGNAGYNTSAEVGETGLASIAGTIIRAVLSLLGVVFVSLIIYGGFLWMTAAGNDEQIGKAKKIMSGALIGLIITLSAFSIYYFISEAILSENLSGSSVVEADGS